MAEAVSSLRIDFEPWATVAAGAVRAAFGVVMAVDAFLKWRPAFADHYVGYLQNAAKAQPTWLSPWFHAWLGLIQGHVGFFVLATRLIETAIALGLLLGLARRITYGAGIVFSVLIWATAEGFGGPYTAGATNIGPALVYALVFVALAVFARTLGSTPYSLDYYLERRFPGWASVAELAPRSVWQQTPPALDWAHQLAAGAAIVVALAVALGTLHSATNVAPPTPTNAAAAVTPLSLSTGAPIAHAAPAVLPPLNGTGDSVAITLIATDATIEIASGVKYNAWTFNGSVPGPIIHVREGQTVHMTFLNHGMMPHSIDLHAAEVAPSTNYRTVPAGATVEFTFVPRVPGAFIYHCGSPPVLMHIGNGMYGAIIVDPKTPLPPADASYVLVESEWYTQQVSGRVLTGNFDKMLAGTPDEMVFNGEAFQYNDQPLRAKVGRRVRLYVVDAGPSFTTAFHVIGAIFDAVYPDGNTEHALTGVSTYPIAPGQGAIFDVTLREPGDYPFVDHSMRAMAIGAVGTLKAVP